MNNELHSQPIRRLFLTMGRSAGWLVDTLALVPPDTMVVGCAHDLATACWVLYLVNPEFTEVEPMAQIPELRVETKVYRSFLGECMLRPDRLIDEATGKEFRPS